MPFRAIIASICAKEHAGVCLLSMLLAFRLLVAFLAHQNFEAGFVDINRSDPRIYLMGAQSILATGVNPFDFFPPLQFFFLAGFLTLCGGETVLALFATTLVQWLTIVTIYMLALKVGGRPTALWAAFLAGFYPLFVYHGVSFYSESLALFWIVATFYAVAKYLSSRFVRHLVAAGFLWGLASLTRGGLIYFSIVVAVVIAIDTCQQDRTFRSVSRVVYFPVAAFVTVFVVSLCISPIHKHTGLDSKNGTAAIIIGANPVTTSSEDFGNIQGNIYYDIDKCNEWPDGILLVPSNMDELSTFDVVRMVLPVIGAHPVQYVKNCFLRLANFWGPNDDVVAFFKVNFFKKWPVAAMFISVALGLTASCVLLFGAAGLFLLQGPVRFMISGFVCYYCALIFFTVGNARLRLPLMPFILVCCAFFIGALYDKKNVHTIKSLLRNKLCVLVLCCVIAVSIYKFREITMTPVEVYLQRIELCNKLGFPKTAFHLFTELKGYALTASQERRLISAELKARHGIR